VLVASVRELTLDLRAPLRSPNVRSCLSGCGATRASLLFACLGKIDLADYLHSDRSFIIGCRDFLKGFDDTSTLEPSQRLDHSRVESASILATRFEVPKPSANPDF
jgi:hypothetical protein